MPTHDGGNLALTGDGVKNFLEGGGGHQKRGGEGVGAPFVVAVLSIPGLDSREIGVKDPVADFVGRCEAPDAFRVEGVDEQAIAHQEPLAAAGMAAQGDRQDVDGEAQVSGDGIQVLYKRGPHLAGHLQKFTGPFLYCWVMASHDVYRVPSVSDLRES